MKKIIVMICVIAIIISSAIAFVGCDKKSEDLSTKPLKSLGGGGGCVRPTEYLCYEASKSIFPIDDVRLTVSCGGQFSEFCEAEGIIVSSFCLNETENKSEVLANPDYEYYAVNLIGTNVWDGPTAMHYTGEIVLPKEVFARDKGKISFKFMVINNSPYIRNYPYDARYYDYAIFVDSTFDTGKESEEIAGDIVFYEVQGDIVMLFNDLK